MIERNIELMNPERYLADSLISRSKLDKAIEYATDKLASKINIYEKAFVTNSSKSFKYELKSNRGWQTGMHTGTFLLAYELTKEKKFLDVAKKHILMFRERIDNKIEIGTHDLGYVYTPSCVAMYKLTGDEQARNIALEAAEYLYSLSYTKEGGFILRSSAYMPEEWACRTMMDTLLNIPLLYWAHKETGSEKYLEAANSQVDITEKYLIRQDGSSNHHYQFNPKDFSPVKGVTLQGASDDSCWSRGQSWGVLGLPLAYSYTGNNSFLNLCRDVTYYSLNHLPENNIPYWDYCFTDGSDEPIDSSAGVITACGMMEALKYIDPISTEAKIYRNASAMMLESVIDICSGEKDFEYDGLVIGVTGSKPHGLGINECALYGDYFYLEALMRYLNPNWKCHW